MRTPGPSSAGPGLAAELTTELTASLEDLVRTGREPGAAVTVRRGGEVLAEVCVGTVDGERPWTPDTLVMCYSIAKPLASLTLLSVVAEGRLRLDQPVAGVWPEYGTAGKEHTTVRQLLCHRAGLAGFPEGAAGLAFDDRQGLVDLLAAAPPEHPPGEAVAEHALTYGHLLGEVVRRATGESLEDRFARIAGERGWDLHLVVAEADEGRVATVVPVVDDWPDRYLDDPTWGPAMGRPAGPLDPDVLNSRRWRTTPFAAVNLHASASGLARFFADLASPDGAVADLLGPEPYAEYVAPQATGVDRVLRREVTWTLGCQLDPGEAGRGELGMGGAGGCSAWTSYDLGYSAAYVTRGLGGHDRGEVAYDVIESVLSAVKADGSADR
jgi:CubicO group peptidase (beta-lactamase class C family)